MSLSTSQGYLFPDKQLSSSAMNIFTLLVTVANRSYSSTDDN